MGTVVAFKRPEPAPVKPPEPEDTRVVFIAEGGKEIVALYLDSFDGITRYLFDDAEPVAERKEFINKLRVKFKLEPLEVGVILEN